MNGWFGYWTMKMFRFLIIYATSLQNAHSLNMSHAVSTIYWQKGGDLTQSYDKSPYTNRNVKRAIDNTNNATKKFD